MRDVRYDRQMRLWGEEGQQSIEATSVCVLGAGALATEILKSLVLAGVHTVCIVDGKMVEESDLGNNFFLEESHIGKARAETTATLLKELNPSVSVTAEVAHPSSLSATDVLSFGRFSVVVATNLNESTAARIGDVLFEQGTPFIHCRTYGLLGFLRISTREHSIANSHAENPRPDLRLDRPFPALEEMFSEINFSSMAHEEFKHTPYIFLYLKALQDYRDACGDPSAFPSTYSARKQFSHFVARISQGEGLEEENVEEAKAAINRSIIRTEVPSTLVPIFNSPNCAPDSDCTEPFWLVCTGLKKFVELHGVLPLSGALPDMTSDSKRYARLASIFHEKARADADEVLELTREVEQTRGSEAVISPELCYRFCKNARFIQVQRGTSIRSEINGGWTNAAAELTTGFCEEGDVPLSAWYILLRAVDRFEAEKFRFPGTNGIPVSLDSADLLQRAKTLIEESAIKEKTIAMEKIPQKAVEEMCRYGASEPHVCAAYLGGIAAQEIIKLSTNQYVPLENTLILDLHTQRSATFHL